jgi:hypothetical protein
LFAFLGSDDEFLWLVTQEPHSSFSSLRRKILTVDAMTTGFALVLEGLLAKHGISWNEVNSSALSRSYYRVQPFQLGAGIGSGELPVCLGVVLVAILLLCSNFLDQDLLVRDPPIETLTRQNTEFCLGHIQPTAVFPAASASTACVLWVAENRQVVVSW